MPTSAAESVAPEGSIRTRLIIWLKPVTISLRPSWRLVLDLFTILIQYLKNSPPKLTDLVAHAVGILNLTYETTSHQSGKANPYKVDRSRSVPLAVQRPNR